MSARARARRASAVSSSAIELANDSRKCRSAWAGPKSRPGVSATWARDIMSKQKSQLLAAKALQSTQA